MVIYYYEFSISIISTWIISISSCWYNNGSGLGCENVWTKSASSNISTIMQCSPTPTERWRYTSTWCRPSPLSFSCDNISISIVFRFFSSFYYYFRYRFFYYFGINCYDIYCFTINLLNFLSYSIFSFYSGLNCFAIINILIVIISSFCWIILFFMENNMILFYYIYLWSNYSKSYFLSWI